jgi:lipoprotein-releasing system permease protein
MMPPLSLFIGLRYHHTKHSLGFISFISKSSTIGIMLGVAVLIIGLSVMNGFERELTHRFLGVISHGEIEAVEQPLVHPSKLLAIAQSTPGVVAAAPYIVMNGLVQRGQNMKPVQVRGIDPKQQLAVTDLLPYLQGDGWSRLVRGEPGVVLGGGIARALEVSPGDAVTLLLPSQTRGKLSAPQRIQVPVLGLLHMGGQLDGQLAFMALGQAQALMNWDDGVSGIAIKTAKPLLAEQTVRMVGYQSSQLVYLKSWTRTHGYLYRDIQMVRTIMYTIMLLIVAVASFNIVSTLILAVSEKRGDLAILKTMGASHGVLIRSFVVYGGYNALMGCLLGTVLGLLGCWGLPELATLSEAWLGHSLLSADIYFIDFLPVELKPSDVAIVVTAASLLSLLATLWPAWQACKVDPARELG